MGGETGVQKEGHPFPFLSCRCCCVLTSDMMTTRAASMPSVSAISMTWLERVTRACKGRGTGGGKQDRRRALGTPPHMPLLRAPRILLPPP